MRVACPSCGGTADIQGEAIRKGLATCSYCDAYIVVASSEHPLQQKIEKEKAKLKIKRRRKSVSVTGRRPLGIGGGGRIEGRACLIGLVPGGYAFVQLMQAQADLIAASFGGFVAFLFVAIIAASFRFYSPPIVLTATKLKSGLLGGSDFQRENVRQVYVAVPMFMTGAPGEEEPMNNGVQINVCVLTRDGRRDVVLGPTKTIEVALAIEQVLEDELGLYNLRVKGEEQTKPGGLKNPAGAQALRPGQLMGCGTCGAKSTPSEADWRRGFTNCPYCNHLSALYEEGGKRVVLDDDSCPVSTEEDEAGVLLVDAQLPFYVDAKMAELRVGRPGLGRQDVVAFSDVRSVCVRAVGGLGSGGGGLIDRLKEVHTHSGQVTVGQAYGAALFDVGGVSFSIMLQTYSGLDRVLVTGVHDPDQALHLRDRIENTMRAA